MKPIALIVTLFFLSACTDSLSTNVEVLKNSMIDNIAGHWSNMEVTDAGNLLRKVDKIPDDQYGITFNEDGTLTEWKNSGWCGTPPIMRSEFDGTWEIINDTLLNIEGTYWGGTMRLEWIIVDVNNKLLSYTISNEEYLSDF
jgi:hypothetical protein